jgi:hypothetical protein
MRTNESAAALDGATRATAVASTSETGRIFLTGHSESILRLD